MSSHALQQFDLGPLFKMLSAIMDDDTEIEVTASKELLLKSNDALATSVENQLSNDFVSVMTHTSANPICAEILRLPFNWVPPETSESELYREHSHFKAHVELLGPDGLIKSDVVRLGLYGMQPNAEYGIRTHPAEEIYVMLAGDCLWMRGEAEYTKATVGERSHHPSYLPHATKTQTNAFMSVYAWIGDLSTEQYAYEGLPK